MNSKIIKTCIAMVLGSMVVGCVSRPSTFEVSSIPVEQGKYTVLSSEVTGTYNQVSFLFLSFGMPGSSQRRALRDALSKVPGADALVGMSVDTEVFEILPFLCPIIGFYTTRVTGTPVHTFND